jgi:hypothetical protein
VDVDLGAGDRERGAVTLVVDERELLPVHGEACGLELRGDVLGGGVVAGRTGGAVAVVAVGDALQRDQVPVDGGDPDLLDQLTGQLRAVGQRLLLSRSRGRGNRGERQTGCRE